MRISEFARRLATVALVLVAVACASSSREAARPNPHYKLGSPYEVNGRRYVPREDASYDAVGVASWYGDEFHGRPTANGEIFDKRRLSAAHTTLPLPSLVEVENLENGKKAIIRVNDRGPFVGDRIIDLSHASAIALGFERAGLARVRVRYVGRADLYASAPLPNERMTELAQPPRPVPPPGQRGASAAGSRVSPPAEVSVRTPSAPPTASTDGPSALPTPVDEAPLPPVAGPPAGQPPAIASGPIPMEPATNEVWIVLDEFDDLQAAEVARSVIEPGEEVRMTSPGERARYSFEIGPYPNRAAAEARLAALREAGYLEARIARSARK